MPKLSFYNTINNKSKRNEAIDHSKLILNILILLAILREAPFTRLIGIQIIYFCIFFVASFGIIYLIFIKQRINKRLLFFFIILLTFNIFSAMSAAYNPNIYVNYSWHLQAFSWIGLFYLSYAALKNNYDFFSVRKFLPIIYIFVFMHLALLYFSFSGARNIFSFEWFLSGSYSFISQSEEFGFDKVGIVMILHAFTILTWPRLGKYEKIFLGCLAIFYPFLIGSRTSILGLLALGTFIYIGSFKYFIVRVISFWSLTLVLLFGAYKYYDVIEQVTISSGRYLLPVFTSIDFYKKPFGFGPGNYTYIAENDLLNINLTTTPVLLIFRSNEGIYDGNPYGLFPASESNWLWFGISFGWIFLLFIGTTFFFLLYKVVIKKSIQCPEVTVSTYLLIYLFFSGLAQDHIYNHSSWIIISFCISRVILYKNKSYVNS